MRRRYALLAIALVLGWQSIGCDTSGGQGSVYSVVEANSAKPGEPFPRTPGVELTLVLSLGRPDGPEEQVFGFVHDVGLAPDGSLYVLDAQFRRIAVFDSGGVFKRSIGKAGAGPGEFLSPTLLAVFDRFVAVYDERLGSVTVFDTSGVFQRSFLVPSGFVLDLQEGPNGGLVLTVFGYDARVLHFDLSGNLRSSYLPPAPIDTLISGPYVPDPGYVCTGPSGIMYANPWIYELVAIDPVTGGLAWAKRWEKQVVEPTRPTIAGVGPAMQRSALLGLQCVSDHILLAYLDRETNRIFYDFFDAEANPQGRLVFPRNPGAESPGYAGAWRRDRIATYRTRPYSQVQVYRVTIR